MVEVRSGHEPRVRDTAIAKFSRRTPNLITTDHAPLAHLLGHDRVRLAQRDQVVDREDAEWTAVLADDEQAADGAVMHAPLGFLDRGIDRDGDDLEAWRARRR